MKKKKIFRRVIALFFAVLTLLSVAIQCSAAMIATGTIVGLAAIASIILVGCGVLSQTEFDALPQRDRYEMTAKYLEAHQTGAVMSVLAAKGLIGDLQEDLQKQIDMITSDTVSSPHDKNTRERLADTFVKFASTHEDSVKKVSGDNSVDMKGFGASMRIDNSAKDTSIPWDMYYSDYIVISKNSSGAVITATFYGDSCVHSWNDIYTGDREASFSNGLRFDNAEMLQSLSTYSTKFYGDIRYTDGTKADEATDVEEVPASIGEVTDADGNTYPVNADGTVTVNGEDIPVNSDGTVTINGDTYYPTYIISNYDDTALIDLIHQLIDTINQGQLIEETPAIDTGEISVPVAAEGFENMTLSAAISQVFPFCIPFDFVRGLKIFNANAVTPVFEFDVTVPSFLNVPEQHWYYKIDLSDWEPLAKITRWCCVISFAFLLVHLSKSLVMGAGG